MAAAGQSSKSPANLPSPRGDGLIGAPGGFSEVRGRFPINKLGRKSSLAMRPTAVLPLAWRCAYGVGAEA
ncbi:hypothetical protein E2562_027934 [Oryza meyeriana var. granulata]|uniref:Uncharacterized protein n=1 Tax=Oryza meyeriana var. granulata TaxID=110450 RepID=A0A6G1CTU2_9ORYZ|nr:hypothetical protein E2562_027934 [Oryza meyeriana var. granulata]